MMANALLLVASLSAAAGAPQVLRTESMTLYVAGSRVGTLTARDEAVDGGTLRLTRTAEMSVARGRETLRLTSTSVTEVAASDLAPRGFHYTRDDGTGVPYRAEGVVTCAADRSCTLEMTTLVDKSSSKKVVPMPRGVTFSTAMEVHARRNLKDGARWNGQVLVEEAGDVKPARYTVTHKGNNWVVDSWMGNEDPDAGPTSALNSVDTLTEAGVTLKSEVPALNGIAVPEGSPAPVPGQKPLDVYAQSTWTGATLPDGVKVVRFELTTQQGGIADLPQDRRQRVLKKEPGRVLVEVRRTPKGPPEKLTEKERRTALAPTPYEPINDPKVRKAAQLARGEAVKPKDVVRNVILWVNHYVQKKDLSRAYAPATATLESRQGDCTEHSVLASALLKANGIPTRLVDGVIAFDGKLGYHEWVEVFVDGEGWYPVDPTFGEPEAGPNRVKFITGSSDPSDLMSMGLSAAQAFRGLRVTIKDSE